MNDYTGTIWPAHAPEPSQADIYDHRTIWYNKNEVLRLHLYAECLDDSIWLEIDQEFSVVTIPFPKEMVKAILESETCKGFAEHGPDLSWLDNLSKKPEDR